MNQGFNKTSRLKTALNLSVLTGFLLSTPLAFSKPVDLYAGEYVYNASNFTQIPASYCSRRNTDPSGNVYVTPNVSQENKISIYGFTVVRSFSNSRRWDLEDTGYNTGKRYAGWYSYKSPGGAGGIQGAWFSTAWLSVRPGNGQPQLPTKLTVSFFWEPATSPIDSRYWDCDTADPIHWKLDRQPAHVRVEDSFEINIDREPSGSRTVVLEGLEHAHASVTADNNMIYFKDAKGNKTPYRMDYHPDKGTISWSGWEIVPPGTYTGSFTITVSAP